MSDTNHVEKILLTLNRLEVIYWDEMWDIIEAAYIAKRIKYGEKTL